MKFKLGKNTYNIYPGDYIMDNGSCLQFFAGDRRIIGWDKYGSYTGVKLTKKAVKDIRALVGGFDFVESKSDYGFKIFIHKF